MLECKQRRCAPPLDVTARLSPEGGLRTVMLLPRMVANRVRGQFCSTVSDEFITFGR